MTKKETFLHYAKEIKNLGYRVFVYSGDYSFNFGYIVNDKNQIGYFQLGDFGYGVLFGTEHKPIANLGSGFSLDMWDEAHETFSRELVDRVFVKYPHWATRFNEKDLQKIEKYTADEFLKDKQVTEI